MSVGQGGDRSTVSRVERLAASLSSQSGAGLSVFAIDQDAVLERVRSRLFGAVEPARDSGSRTRVGRFELTRRVRAGAAGVVFVARDLERDREISLELLLPWIRGREALSRAVFRVRLLAAALDRAPHPHVLSIRDVGCSRGRLFIATERFAGRSLARWLADERRAWRSILDVFEQAGQGLAELHAAGLAHETFTPESVLVAEDGAARLSGLERASLVESGGRALSATQRVALTGAPRYMSPEELSGRRRDAHSDQFRFCAALYEALVGAPPFEGATLDELVQRVISGQRARRAGEREVPPWVLAVVARGLAPEPCRRWSSMGALLTALRESPKLRRRRWIRGVKPLARARRQR